MTMTTKIATYTRLHTVATGYVIRDRLGDISHFTENTYGLFFEAIAARNKVSRIADKITLFDEVTGQWMFGAPEPALAIEVDAGKMVADLAGIAATAKAMAGGEGVQSAPTTGGVGVQSAPRGFLTFEEFQASKVEVADLDKAGIDMDRDTPVPGFVYDGSCWIEKMDDGQFFLLIETSDWIDADLAKLERILWSSHYCLDRGDDVRLSVDDGTLDDFIVGQCDARGIECDGDLYGHMLSGMSIWTPQDARAIVAEAAQPVRA
jgi:hypothetical protein